MTKSIKFWCLCGIFSAVICAQDPSTNASAAVDNNGTPQQAAPVPAVDTSAVTAPKPGGSLRDRLVEKLTKRDGSSSSIVVFSAVESPSTELGTEISKTIALAFQNYGKLNIRQENYALSALTMEDIRIAMARFNVDVLITPLIRGNTIDLYLFDRRFPYNLYAHTEEVPGTLAGAPAAQVAQEMTRVLLKRLLYRYLNDQFFELPREESLPVLQAEIPQWVASDDSLRLVNNELTSRFYLNFSFGAAMNMSRSGQLWNSNAIGAQLGVRLFDKLFFETQFLAFSYNAFVGSLRYTFVNKESPFRVNVGLGFAFVTRDMVWNLDQTLGLGRYSYYFVPSAALLFPIGEVYLKLEAQSYVAPDFSQFIWTLLPGVQIHF